MVDTISDLYIDTSIVVHTPMGHTDPIFNKGRDTVKGDAISPVVFILTIESLIQSLALRNSSYKFQTSSQRLGPLAFADDLVLVTETSEQMVSQTSKITAFLKWSGLEDNMNHLGKNKTAITNQVYGMRGSPHTNFTIAGMVVPRLKPTEPYTYLGQVTALHSSQKSQHAPLLSKFTGVCQQITHAVGTPGLKIRMVEQVL